MSKKAKKVVKQKPFDAEKHWALIDTLVVKDFPDAPKT